MDWKVWAIAILLIGWACREWSLYGNDNEKDQLPQLIMAKLKNKSDDENEF